MIIPRNKFRVPKVSFLTNVYYLITFDINIIENILKSYKKIMRITDKWVLVSATNLLEGMGKSWKSRDCPNDFCPSPKSSDGTIPGFWIFLEKHDLLMKSVSSTHKGHSFLPSEMRLFNTIKRRQSNTTALVQQKSLSSTQMRQFHKKALYKWALQFFLSDRENCGVCVELITPDNSLLKTISATLKEQLQHQDWRSILRKNIVKNGISKICDGLKNHNYHK